jgi:itaconate CoA-transferase
VNDLQGLWEHEQLRARDRFVPVQTPGGVVELLASPFDISGWVPPAGRVPALDEHDVAVVDAVIRRGDGD